MATKKDSKIKSWQSYSEQINWTKVREAVDTVPLNSLNAEMAYIAVWDAAEKWCPLDFAAFDVLGIEKRVEFTPAGCSSAIKGFIDLSFQIKEDSIKPYSDYFPGKVVVDWKSTGGRVFASPNTDGGPMDPQFGGTVNQLWKERYTTSWQGKMYARAEGAKLIEYRGISQLREYASLIIGYLPSWDAEVDEYIAGVAATYNGLMDAQLPVWPRRMPKSCGSYGRDCIFKKSQECLLYTMPQGVPPRRELSFSFIEQFFDCPEKARRFSLDRELNDGSDATDWGNAVHAGLASVYSQLSGVDVTERKSAVEIEGE